MGQQNNEFTATIKSKEDDFVPIDDDFEPVGTSDLDPIQGTPSFGALQGVKFNPDFPPEETPAEEPGLFDRIYGAVMNAPKFITEPVREATQSLLEPKWDPQATETGNIREAQLRGFIGGATRAASEQLSLGNLISAMGGGVVPRTLSKLIGTAQVTHGARELLQGDKLKGISEIGFGALGLLPHGSPKLKEKFPVNEPIPDPITPPERLPIVPTAVTKPPVIDVQPTVPDVVAPTTSTTSTLDKLPPLPNNLKGAKPRYNMGKTSYSPEFESDLDKALFIIAQKTPSKQDAQYLKYVMDTLDTDEANARALGKMVRDQLKTILKGQPAGAVKIPQIHNPSGRFTGGMPDAPSPTATATPRVSQPTPRRTRSDNSGIPELSIVGDEPDAQGNWWKWAKRTRSARTGDVDVTKLDNPIAKLIVKLRQSRILNEEQKKIYRRELGKKHGNMENVKGGTATERAAARGAERGGKFEKVSFDPLDLHPDEIEYLHQAIEDAGLNQFEMARAADAIASIQHGEVPQDNQIKLLSSIFTHKLTRDLRIPRAQASNISNQFMRTISAIEPKSATLWDEADALSRDLLSSTDFSAPGKQGLPLAHTKEWRESWKPAIKAVGSRKVFEAEQLAHQGIDSAGNIVDAEANRLFKVAQEGGLSLSDVETTSRHEEGFLGSVLKEEFPGTERLRENYPKLAKAINAPGAVVRGSERGYSAYLNKLRMDYFKRLYTNVEKFNETQPEYARINPEEAAENIANFINTVTGRGKLKFLGKDLEKYSNELNDMFFAPRLQARNFEMLTNPWFYVNQPDYLRKEAVKAGLTLGGFVLATNGLGALAGGSTNLKESTSPTFGKVGFGKTFLDPGAGGLQLVTAMSRMAANSAITASGRHVKWNEGYNPRNDFTTIVDFLTSKASPRRALQIEALKGVDFEGKPISIPAELIKSYIPILIQDTHAVLQKDPDLMIEMPKDKRALAAIPYTFFGGGSQTYK